MGNLGWPEILIILGIALIIFGPRKLPELGKSLGQSLAQFRRASEDFKRTWEDEVEAEKRKISAMVEETESVPVQEETNPYELKEPAEEPYNESPDKESPVEQTAAAEQGEAVAQESRRDWA